MNGQIQLSANRACRKYVWVLEKVWFDGQLNYNRSDCWPFDSFLAANRAMFDDWTEEYDNRPDRQALDEDFEQEKHDSDGFWERQSRPFLYDDECDINFRDGSKIEWRIYNREVETLSHF